jgi:hypothetical protein
MKLNINVTALAGLGRAIGAAARCAGTGLPGGRNRRLSAVVRQACEQRPAQLVDHYGNVSLHGPRPQMRRWRPAAQMKARGGVNCIHLWGRQRLLSIQSPCTYQDSTLNIICQYRYFGMLANTCDDW